MNYKRPPPESPTWLMLQMLGTLILGVIMWVCIIAIFLVFAGLLHSGVNWVFPPQR